MGSYYLREFHMRWFRDHNDAGAQLRDISDDYAGFSVNGPKARQILEKISDTDLSGLKMMNCMTADLGLFRVKIARLSLSGEMAFEVSCHGREHASLRKALLEAGADFGLREIGFRAMLSLRLEKSIGIWNGEFTQAYTPAMTGLDRWIAWDKSDFIGKEAARNATPPARVLRMIEVDAKDADCVGFEPLWQDGTLVGITTTGGYGHRLGRSFAMALVDTAHAGIGTNLTVHVMGEERPAKIIEMSPYDPAGSRMRA
jgi:dimethylglycine dehydrogenase